VQLCRTLLASKPELYIAVDHSQLEACNMYWIPICWASVLILRPELLRVHCKTYSNANLYIIAARLCHLQALQIDHAKQKPFCAKVCCKKHFSFHLEHSFWDFEKWSCGTRLVQKRWEASKILLSTSEIHTFLWLLQSDFPATVPNTMHASKKKT